MATRTGIADHAIPRIIEKLRDGHVDEALAIVRGSLRTASTGPEGGRLRLYLGFCGIRKLKGMTSTEGNGATLLNVCTEVATALKAAWGTPSMRSHAAARNVEAEAAEGDVSTGEIAVEAALLLGDLALALRDHVRDEMGPHGGDTLAARCVRDLYRWAAKAAAGLAVGGDAVADRAMVEDNDTTGATFNPLASAYRTARTMYTLAAARSATLPEKFAGGTVGRASRRSQAKSDADGPEPRRRWLWAVNMVRAEFSSGIGYSAIGDDPATCLLEAQKHAPHVGSHPIGEGLWAAFHAGCSLQPIGCTLMALGRLQMTHSEMVAAARSYEEAARHFAEACDLHGGIALLAARADLAVRSAERATGADRERLCAEVAEHAKKAIAMPDDVPGSGAPEDEEAAINVVDYARELGWQRSEAQLFNALARAEELREAPDREAVLTQYITAYDAAGRTEDPHELLHPLLRIGAVYRSRGSIFEADDTLKKGLAIARALGHRGYVWQFEAELACVFEKQGNYQEALRHEREAGAVRAEFHQEQLRDAVARQLVDAEFERAELRRRQAGERARQLEKLHEQVQLQNKELAARLGERAQVIEGMTKAARQTLKSAGVARKVINQLDRKLAEFSRNDSGWLEFDKHIDARIPEFLNELIARAPNLTATERRICILMRDEVPVDDICVVIKRRKPESEKETEQWRVNMDRHRFNILVKLRSFGALPLRGARRAADGGAGSKAALPKKRKPLGMRLSTFLRFFGNEPGDMAYLASLRERAPGLSRADELLCRHLRRGFSPELIAEFYNISPAKLAARVRGVAAVLNVQPDALRPA